ncbi:WD repeat-containing protein 85-like [Tropilaelaps mercedesae]|uniref:WD repeat-containing protein 85-like n=1 Tax=Tropilaelaps mercedesae TaxID=418985 RepID=A0A1V9XW82_9ACAR|nr:WD repeat-containing protein 85-like [Tropilaelaps mercedesae]
MTLVLDQLKMHANCDAIAMCSDGKRFLLGTYELHEGIEQLRHGSISLFTSNGDKFELMTTCEAPAGVLDIKFRKAPTVTRDDSSEVFAVALADGTVRVGQVSPDDQVKVEEGCKLSSPSSSTNTIALSVSWMPADTDRPRVAATFNTGVVREYQLTNNASSFVVLREYSVSTLEVWAVLHRGPLIYTGGDDSKLWRTATADGSSRVIRRFSSGVTAIEADPLYEENLLVGTYEDRLYQFDLRMMRDPLQEVDIGGGVWRIKDHPARTGLLAVAGMYAGAFIVDCCLETWAIKQRYTGHESMCYGIEWWDEKTLLSCSFYDRQLTMWRLLD